MIKKLIAIAFFLPLLAGTLNAQSDEEKKVKAEVWTNAPEEFKVTQIPDKWKDESAVIIATSLDYNADFATKMQGISVVRFYVETVTSHHRIKLIDKAAVKEYSELTFNEKYVNTNLFGKTNSYFIIAVKVIKASGTEKEIDLNKAVKADSESKKGLKIAIPDLEPGDIIDYFSAAKEEYTEGTEGSISDNFLFEGDYPVMKRTMRFKIPQQYEIKSKVYNGAPDFEKKFEDRDVIYLLEDKMRDKSGDILWTYDHRTAPEIRFTKVSKNSYYSSADQSAQSFVSGFNNGNIANIGFITDYMNENFRKEKDQIKMVNEMYYLLRNPIYLQAYFGIEQGHPLDLGYVNDSYFQLVSKFLLKNKISHNVMVVPSAEYGNLNEQNNLNYADALIRVNTTPPMYLPRLKPFAMPNEIAPEYEGMSGVISEVYPKNGVNAEGTSVPATTANDNITTTTLDVNLNADDNSNVDVKRNVVAKGHNKEAHQYLVVTNYDYLKEYDQPKYQAESSHLIGGLLKQYNKEKEKYEQRLTQDYNERDKKLKDDVESSMNVKVAEYKNFKLKTIGMWDYAPNTEYTDEFTIENLTKKAGQNYILELAKLIEKQTEITDKQRTRDRDIYMNNARKFVNVINFTIPEGFTVEGLENFNKEVKNSTGGFKCTAVVEGNILKITTEKYYSGNYFEAKDWSKMVEFLDAAVAFTNAKILLKKK
ncbi:MAG: hypothetical protein JWP12_2426 [Bacteroidetes bacterium]|nr:hypothetical protein [Bacteroidota bacterium]